MKNSKFLLEAQGDDIDSLFFKVLSDIRETGLETGPVTDPLSIASNFGLSRRSMRELIGYKFVLTDPRARILFNEDRNFNLFFALGQFIWNLACSDEVDHISFYNGRGKEFSDDGKTVHGSSYWKRIASPVDGSQIRAIISRIRRDPSTRRTFAAIFQPLDNLLATRDVPCPIGVQYFLRENRLIGVTYMRSNSAVFMMPYNVFFFTMLQELLANELGVELGNYLHVSGSLHYYADEQSIIDRILNSKVPEGIPMKPMPGGSNFENVTEVVSFEKELRAAADSEVNIEYWLDKAKSFDTYWTQVCYLLLSHALSRTRQTDQLANVVELLDPEYKSFGAKLIGNQQMQSYQRFNPSITH